MTVKCEAQRAKIIRQAQNTTDNTVVDHEEGQLKSEQPRVEISTLKVKYLPKVLQLLHESRLPISTYTTVGDIRRKVPDILLFQYLSEDLDEYGGDTIQYHVQCGLHEGPDTEHSVDDEFVLNCSNMTKPLLTHCHCGEVWDMCHRIGDFPKPHICGIDVCELEVDDIPDYGKVARRNHRRKKIRCSNKKHSKSIHPIRCVGGKRRILESRSEYMANSSSQMSPADMAQVFEEVIGKLWLCNHNRNWPTVVLSVLEIIRKLKPEYTLTPHIVRHIEWFKEEFDNTSQLTWGEIADKVKTGLLKWEVFCTTRFSKFITSLAGYVVLFLFHPKALVTLTKFNFEALCHRFSTYKYDPTNVVTSVWGLFDDIMNIVKVFNDTGSMEVALVRDAPYVLLIQDIAKCKAYYGSFMAGNLENSAGMTENEFINFLKGIIDRIGEIRLTVTPVLQRTLDSELKSLTTMSLTVVDKSGSGAARVKPYSYLILGKSQVGKTVLNRKLIPVLLDALGEKHTSEYVYSVKEGNNFLDGYLSYMTGASFDDISNFIKLEPKVAELLIAIINNEPYNVEAAMVELKGRIWCLLKVLGCTTNVTDLALDTQIREVTAIWNRFNVQIEMMVDPEYASVDESGAPTKLDSSKMTPEQLEKIFPDIHLFTLYRTVVKSVKNDMKLDVEKKANPFKPDKWAREIVVFDGRRMENLRIDELLRYLVVDAKNHHRKQDQVLKTIKRLDTEELICTSCKLPNDGCTCRSVCVCGAPKYNGIISPGCSCGLTLSPSAGTIPDLKIGTDECMLCKSIDQDYCDCLQDDTVLRWSSQTI